MQQAPERYEIVGALLRDPKKTRDFDWAAIPVTLSPEDLTSTRPDVVVDVLSDGELGAQLSLNALSDGVHVVSANKQAIAAAHEALVQAAKSNNASLLYSAAVGGGAPILEAIRLACEAESDIHTIEGVLNGTVNLVLDRLGDGDDLNEALALARKAGHRTSPGRGCDVPNYSALRCISGQGSEAPQCSGSKPARDEEHFS